MNLCRALQPNARDAFQTEVLLCAHAVRGQHTAIVIAIRQIAAAQIRRFYNSICLMTAGRPNLIMSSYHISKWINARQHNICNATSQSHRSRAPFVICRRVSRAFFFALFFPNCDRGRRSNDQVASRTSILGGVMREWMGDIVAPINRKWMSLWLVYTNDDRYSWWLVFGAICTSITHSTRRWFNALADCICAVRMQSSTRALESGSDFRI